MQRIKTIYDAGRVTRLHTTPHHQPYTVAHHSWGMAALLYQLYPGKTPSHALVRACLEHDVPESVVGDVPRPAKWRFPKLEEAMRHAEATVMEELRIESSLSVADAEWLAALDLLELYLFCAQEIALGNRGEVVNISAKCSELLASSWVPEAVQAFVLDLRQEVLPL